MRSSTTSPCPDPAYLRELARDKRGRAALLSLEVMNLEREADQLEHEAALWDVADAAEDALQALIQKTAGFEANAEGTLAARRAAEDKLGVDRKHLARRKGEVTRLQGSGSREAQDEAAVRLHKSEQRVADAGRELEAADREHQAAEAALDAHRAALREASAACERALEAGDNPGVARRASPLKVGLGRPEDMTPEEKNLLAVYALAATVGSGGRSHSEVADRTSRGTRGELARQDPNGFRYVRTGTGMVAIPPDWRGTRPPMSVCGQDVKAGPQGRACPRRAAKTWTLSAGPAPWPRA